ncbi:ABC transporter ATP-binding protein [Ichthyobacterium seriolicida]|uniref:Xenobiotic ABC transporter ATP-binding protein n=1 Tax=Ichthyobacterium seriolicida TaxID=242600 RepID=A0A1J1E7L7_9FLAO|nr:ABC transporter ATP-binding protein [Ichthyobacterium seriolicida]BAV95326.1 xenobiotic ABC transporter ATP-binding protein [Ichthyobacterium seriolicida]
MKKKRNIKTLFKLIKFAKKYKKYYYSAIFIAILLSIVGTIRPVLIKISVDNYIVPKQFEGFVFFICIILFVLLIEVIFQFCFVYLAGWLANTIVKDLRDMVFKHILYMRVVYFNKTKIGTLITRVVSDINTIANIFEQGLLLIFGDVFKLSVITIIMLYVNYKLALLVFMVFPIMLWATKIFQSSIKTAFNDVRDELTKLNIFIQERIVGMKIVQLFNRENYEYEKFKEINNNYKQANIRTILYFSIFFPVVEILSSLALLLVVWYGGYQIVFYEDMTLGDIFAFIVLINMLFRPLRQMADKFNTLQMGIIAAERVFVLLNNDDREITDKDSISLKRIDGNIIFDDVHFSYSDNNPVLKGISFGVKAGQTVAIVGTTGAGKSTIINLVNRFYDISRGSITIDGISIKKIRNLRNHIGLVSQDVFLFSESILYNVTLNQKSISRECVIEGAKEIGIHDFIMTLPGNYDYNIKERGGVLSVGQRQLISFLRVYVTNPSILILDEATSSVDSYSEMLIQKAINKIIEGRTSIVIAHRLATIQKADKILVVEKGKLVEQGDHSQLLKIENGYYKRLYQTQFKDREREKTKS